MNALPPPPQPPPPAALPPPPQDPERSGRRAALLWGSITFALYVLVLGFMPDPGCRSGVCGAANWLLLGTLLAEPVLATIVASMRAGRAARRVGMGARALIAAAIALAFVGGLLLGEVLRGLGDPHLSLIVTIPFAAAFLWPVPFVIATFTSWVMEGRRAFASKRRPIPRGDA